MLGESPVAENTLQTASATALEEPAALAFPPSWGPLDAPASVRARAFVARIPWPILLITVAAAVLRFAELSGVSPNQFYDAAVRSMSMSWHNLFFGAFDPGATLSVDKPPLDLWLQVLSVKVLGWGPFALKLPEALGGTLSVPLLYDAVRRAVGRPAGLAAAAALAVFPESVLTSRSETMDSVMMLLVIAALWLTIRGTLSGRRRPIVLAGVALGLAFNVKLLEPLVAVPALVALYALASRLPWRRKLHDMALAAAALVGVGLSWAVAVSLAPGRHPWAVGSTDGSIWNAMFVFNGFGKASSSASTKPGGPGPFRLLVSTGWHYDLLFGCVLVAALAIGIAGLLAAARQRRPRRSRTRSLFVGAGIARAFAISLAVWIAFGLLVFDTMQTVHARYLEAMAPALAAAIGYGAAALAGLAGRGERRGNPSLATIAGTLAAVCAYTFSFRPQRVAWGAAALIAAALGAALLAQKAGARGRHWRWATAGLIVASVMTFPAHETLKLVREKANDSLGLATASPANISTLSRYLLPRTAGIRYELAVDEPLALAPLIVQDRRPILPLTTFAGQPLFGLRHLLAAVRSGAVRYGLVANSGCGPSNARLAACAATAIWIRHNGVDVTREAGLQGSSHLYLLPVSRAG
jgi:4-amino-4-deoxy-L-arabinose transferase-like glycosyltransferase